MSQPTIPQQLQQLRKQQGITLDQLASSIGSDKRRISLMENGHSNPSLDLVLRVSHALGHTLALIPVSTPVPAASAAGSTIPAVSAPVPAASPAGPCPVPADTSAGPTK